MSRVRKQTVAALTTTRSEYYQWRPVLRELQKSRKLNLKLLVSGSHLTAKYGKTITHIKEDGFPVAEELPILEKEIAIQLVNKLRGRSVDRELLCQQAMACPRFWRRYCRYTTTLFGHMDQSRCLICSQSMQARKVQSLIR